MANKASYLVDLAGIKFDDSTESTDLWIQAMPLGTYEHPQYGTINITPERVSNYVNNIKQKVRSTDLDIDYDHKQYGGEAAGWIKDAEDRGQDGLWILVNWTNKAWSMLKDRAYRYFSAEFDDEWIDPKTQITHKDVIFGGALTNRPFLKDIMPINLSEVFANVPYPTKSNEGGSSTMTPEQIKEFAKKLGLSEDSTEAQVMEALEKFSFTPAPAVAPAAPAVPAPTAEQLAALEAAKKLSEGNPAIATIMSLYTAQAELVESQGKQLAEFSNKLREEKVEKTVKALNDKAKAKGYVIPPAMVESLKGTLLSVNDESVSKVILEGFERIIDSQVVALGERGYLRGKTANEDGQTAGEEYDAEVRKLMEGDDGMSFADASEFVAKRNPDLYNRVRSEAYAFGGDN